MARAARGALALALLAALAAPAAPHANRTRRVGRASGELEPTGPGTDVDVEVEVDTEAELGAAELAEVEEVPAWRELWLGALARREPALNGSRADVLAQLGAAAFLHCPVRHAGARGVSWLRRRDWHILSSGPLLYTNDERFQVLHTEGSDDWILQIKYVQQRDNGTYECQVSTRGGTLSRLVSLRVAEPEALILGAADHHVDAGSTLSLVCVIEKSPVPPQYVFWFHNERMINYDAARGVAVRTERGARTHSTLALRRAAPAHSGNYSCRAPNTLPATVHVYVSEGSDKMAATLSRNLGGARRGSPALAAAALAALLGVAPLACPCLCSWMLIYK